MVQILVPLPLGVVATACVYDPGSQVATLAQARAWAGWQLPPAPCLRGRVRPVAAVPGPNRTQQIPRTPMISAAGTPTQTYQKDDSQAGGCPYQESTSHGPPQSGVPGPPARPSRYRRPRGGGYTLSPNATHALWITSRKVAFFRLKLRRHAHPARIKLRKLRNLKRQWQIALSTLTHRI